MGDKAHVGLVNAHAKGNRGHHHHAVFAQKPVLVALAQFAVQPCVVGQRVNPGFAQGLRYVFHLFARLAVDDAGVVRVFALNKAQQLRGGFALFDNRVADVGPIETADKGARVLKLQALKNVGARQVVGGGGQRHAWHAGKALVQHGQRPVFGAEVVAPLAHAMRLVNRKQAELAALEQRVELRQKARRGDALGRRVQERDVAAQQALFNLVGLFTRERGI